MSVHAKMTAIADEVRTLSGATDKLSLDEMASHTREANTEVSEQAELIQQLKSILQGKTEGGVPEDLSAELNEQETLIEQLRTALKGKTAGGCDHTIETWIFTLEDGTTVEKAVAVDA